MTLDLGLWTLGSGLRTRHPKPCSSIPTSVISSVRRESAGAALLSRVPPELYGWN